MSDSPTRKRRKLFRSTTLWYTELLRSIGPKLIVGFVRAARIILADASGKLGIVVDCDYLVLATAISDAVNNEIAEEDA